MENSDNTELFKKHRNHGIMMFCVFRGFRDSKNPTTKNAKSLEF